MTLIQGMCLADGLPQRRVEKEVDLTRLHCKYKLPGITHIMHISTWDLRRTLYPVIPCCSIAVFSTLSHFLEFGARLHHVKVAPHLRYCSPAVQKKLYRMWSCIECKWPIENGGKNLQYTPEVAQISFPENLPFVNIVNLYQASARAFCAVEIETKSPSENPNLTRSLTGYRSTDGRGRALIAKIRQRN